MVRQPNGTDFLRLARCWLACAPLMFAMFAAHSQESSLLSRQCGGCHNLGLELYPDPGSDPLTQLSAADLAAVGPRLQQIAFEREPKDIVRVMLYGKFDRAGDMGGHAIPVMPQLDRLSDTDIAAVVNELYERIGWRRNSAGRPVVPVTPSMVATERRLSNFDLSERSMTAKEYDRATALYFEHCAGCHGVNREGGGGPALHDFRMRGRGTSQVQRILHAGAPIGMPRWGGGEGLTNGDLSALARFLQESAPAAPVFTRLDVRNSWRVLVPLKDRPRRREFAVPARDLFVAVLHDVGQVLLIDARRKEVLSSIPVDLAPHEIELSPDGRYLYVMSRDARISLIDLYMAEPKVVARVRVAIAGRALALGRKRRGGLLVAGGFWPPQYSVLDSATLEPMKTDLIDEQAYASGSSVAEVTQVAGLARNDHFVLVTKTEGGLHHRAFDRSGAVVPQSLRFMEGPPLLRAGSFDLSGRYLLIPSDTGRVVVLDTRRGEIVQSIVVSGLFGGSRGSALVDPANGPVWVVGSMQGDTLSVISTDPEGAQPWRVVRTLALPGAGSLNTAAHSDSSNLWLDISLNSNPEISESGFVFDTRNFAKAPKRLPIAAWAGIAGEGARVLHPQYNAAGNEVWFTVWNQRSRESAVVVVDDDRLALKRVIKDKRLITPIRTYSLAGLLNERRGGD